MLAPHAPPNPHLHHSGRTAFKTPIVDDCARICTNLHIYIYAVLVIIRFKSPPSMLGSSPYNIDQVKATTEGREGGTYI